MKKHASFGMLSSLLVFGIATLLGCTTYSSFDEAGIYYEFGELVRAVSQQTAESGVPRIVVGEFLTPDGRITVLDRQKQMEFISRMVTIRQVQVAERRELERALMETQYNINQVLRNPEDIPDLGQFLPAYGILVATITELSDSLRLDLRIFSTEQGLVVAAATGFLYLPDDERILLSQVRTD